jgi:Asp-tRNA(Asn)/Glu-tRNA(Gln) amidotransferase C subunit
MEEMVRKLNAEYGFGLTEEEIKVIAQQAEETKRMLQRLYQVDVSDVMPIMKVEKRRAKK